LLSRRLLPKRSAPEEATAPIRLLSFSAAQAPAKASGAEGSRSGVSVAQRARDFRGSQRIGGADFAVPRGVPVAVSIRTGVWAYHCANKAAGHIGAQD